MISFPDSTSKIIETYFAVVTAERFTYQGTSYEPKALLVSPLVFRPFKCVAKCGACCPRFSLDYIPSEAEALAPDWEPVLSDREVEFNGRRILIKSDVQEDLKGEYHCRHLNHVSGLCKIHGSQPFSCDFEPLRVLKYKDPDHPNVLMSRSFGRGWRMLRYDGLNRGALCEFGSGGDPEAAADSARKMRRLKQWTDYFGLRTRLDPIIDWMASGPHKEPLSI